MGQEKDTPTRINLHDASEVKYWMRRFGITRSQLQKLAKTMNKPATDQLGRVLTAKEAKALLKRSGV